MNLPPLDRLLSATRVLTLLAVIGGLASARVEAQPSSDPLPTFWRTDGIVNALAVTNGIAYVGGDFTYVGPDNGSGVVVDTDFGGLVSGTPKLNGTVRAVASDGNGGWFVGGVFTAASRPELKNLVHILRDNTIDPNFSPNPDAAVRTLLLLPEGLIVGGEFFQIASNTATPYLAFLNPATGGTNSSRLRANNAVLSMALDGTTLYLGGTFSALTTFNGPQGVPNQRQRLAAYDLATGQVLPWNPTCSGGFEGVKAITVNSTTVYVAGDFTQCGTKPRNAIAALNKTDGVANNWNPNAQYPAGNPSINALALVGNVLYVGGDFTTIGARPRTRLAALQAGGFGQADANWQADASDIVTFILPFGTDLLVGGKFVRIGGSIDSSSGIPVHTGATERRGVARIAQATAAVSDWGPSASLLRPLIQGAATVWAVAMQGQNLFLGGDFLSAGGELRQRLAAIDLRTGAATGWNPRADLAVRALALAPSGLYVGGGFTNIGGQARPRAALLSYATGLAEAWNPNVQGQFVSAIAVGTNSIFLGGQFQNVGGQPRTSLAEVSPVTASVTDWNPQPGGPVYALLYDKGQVYVGGGFFGISGSSQQYLALLTTRVEPANQIVKTFNPQPDGQVRSLALSPDRLFVGGDFSRISNLDRKGFAAIDPLTGQETNPLDLQATIQGQVQGRVVLPLGSTVYMGGQFRGAGGENRARIASVHNVFGVASGWDPGADAPINALAKNDDVIVIGGEFTRLALRGPNPNPFTEGQPVQYLAAFNAKPSVQNIRKNATGQYMFNVNDGDGLGTSVQVQTNERLDAPNWTTLTTLEVLGLQDPFTDTTSPATRTRFYRLVRQP